MPYCVKVNSEVSEVLQELAFLNSYSWCSNDGENVVEYLDAPYLFLWEDKSLAYSYLGTAKAKVITVSEAIHIIKNGKLPVPPQTFFLEDLKVGMRVTTRNGKSYIYLEANTVAYSEKMFVNPVKDSLSWINYKNYNNDLTSKYGTEFDIMKAELLSHPYAIFYEYGQSTVVFERVE